MSKNYSLETILSSKVRVIQSSGGRTGSTLLTNILYGLFCYDQPFFYSQKNITQDQLKNNFIIKTHNTNFDSITKNNSVYSLFFVCSERPEISEKINHKYKNRTNVILFDYYSELLEKINFSIEKIVSNIVTKLKEKIPEDIMKFSNKELAIRRVLEMNQFYETIKDMPFSYHDDYYGIHGSHKNRNKKSK